MAPSKTSSSPLYSFTTPLVGKDQHYRSTPLTLCKTATTSQTTTTTTTTKPSTNPFPSTYSIPTGSTATVKDDAAKTTNDHFAVPLSSHTTTTCSTILPVVVQVQVQGSTIPRQANGRALRRRRTVALL